MRADDLAISGLNRSGEDARVEAWRIEQCLALGYPVETAESLAVSDADLHHLAHLVRDGCPLELAARIV